MYDEEHVCIQSFNSFLHVSNLELMLAQLQQHLKVCILYDVVVRFITIVICNACTLLFISSQSCTSTGAIQHTCTCFGSQYVTVDGKHFEESSA